MLVHWGKELFSFWAIILSARAIILFLSDGYVRFVVNQYNLFYHTDEPKANRVLASGISFLVLLSLATIAVLLSAFWFFPSLTTFVFDANSSLFTFLPLCLITYIGAASVQNIQRMYAATKETKGLVWHNMLIEVVLIATEVSVLGFLLIGGNAFATVVLADSSIILLVAFLYLFYLFVTYPLGKVWSVQLLKEGAQNFREATQLYASNFFEKLTTDGLVLLLSFFRFDKAAIALFATVRTLVNTPLLAQNLLLNSYTPEMQKHFSLRDEGALKRLLGFIRLRIGLLLLLGIVLCLPLYEPVFVYWTKGKIDYNEPFMLTMLAMAVFNLYGLSFAFVLKGLNALKPLLSLMLLKAILLFLSFIWLSPNIVSFAAALLVVELITAVLVLPILLQKYATKHSLHFSLSENIKQFLPYALAALCLFLWYWQHS